jgi:hypothetical protein
VAEVIVVRAGGGRSRGSGYRVTVDAVLTAAHVVEGAASVTVRFEPDLPDQWSADAVAWRAVAGSDLAIISIVPRNDDPVEPARFGQVGSRAAILPVQAVGFPRWKMRTDDLGSAPDGRAGRYRDSHHAVGRVNVLSNSRERTLEVELSQPPAPDRDAGRSPWEGMSGAAVWAGHRIIGVISTHYPTDGLARLTAKRVDLATGHGLRELLALPETSWDLPDVLQAEHWTDSKVGTVSVTGAAHAPPGRPLQQVTDPIELEVHPAIEVPDVRDLPVLPPYLERDHDLELRDRISKSVHVGQSRMVVLVGGSSTGKTRACWEAIHARETTGTKLLEGWRVWHPFDPTPTDALLDGLDRLTPYTVVWLNQADLYLRTEGSDLGERVAARLRTTLRDPDRAPLIVLGTIWPEHWDILTRAADDGKHDPHAQARELLTGTNISMAESFDPRVLERLTRTPGQDPRLVEAATHARGGELTQYLAGAPALLDRYETARSAAKALLHAAMDLRRLGHGPALPLALLEACTPGYLSDHYWDDLDDDWFSSALTDTQQRCHGDHRPLTKIRPRPGQPEPAQPLYRLADYLEQIGRSGRKREIIPAAVWPELANHITNPADAAALGAQAHNRLLYHHAIPLLRPAAVAGNENAALRLTLLLTECGDVPALRDLAVYSEQALWALADLLVKQGDVEALLELIDTGSQAASHRLARLYFEQDDIPALRELAAARSWGAAGLLALALAKQGNVAAAVTIMQDPEATAEAENEAQLADLLAERGEVSALRDLAATGNEFAWAVLPQAIAEEGDIAGALAMVRASPEDGFMLDELANILAEQGDLPALNDLVSTTGDRYATEALAALLVERGDVSALHDLAATTDNDHIAKRLANLLVERGDIPTLQELSAAGSRSASEELAKLFYEQRDVQALRKLSDGGNETASGLLALTLAEQGDINGGVIVMRDLLAVSHETASMWWCAILLVQGDVPYLRKLADEGNVLAPVFLADLLAGQGDVGELRWEVLRGNFAAQRKLIQMRHGSGDGIAERILRHGLNADGSFRCEGE